MKKPIFAIAFLLLSACATTETTVSYNNLYSDYNCPQLKAEMGRLSSKIDNAMMRQPSNEILDAAIAAYSISQGRSGRNRDGQKMAELEKLNNQYDAVDRLYIKNGCVK